MKKKFKKGLSLLLTICTICLFATGLQAQVKTLEVKSSLNDTVKAGSSVVQTITLGEFVGIVGGVRAFKFEIIFDSTRFIASVASANATITADELIVSQATAGKLVVIYADTDNGNTPALAEDVLKITYTSKSDAILGAATFTLSSGTTVNFIDCANLVVEPTSTQAIERNALPAFKDDTSTITIKLSNGDVDGSRSVTISDLALMKFHLLKISFVTGDYLSAGDVNDDTVISISDLISVKKHLLGIAKFY